MTLGEVEKLIEPEPNSGCWLWIGPRNSDTGYGMIRTHSKNQYAHRVVYETVRGAIPDGLTLDHLCRVRPCVNPNHLDPVTIGVNILRGESQPAQNARKTHCAHGHPFDERNTYSPPGNPRKRQCRACVFLRHYDRFHPVGR